MLLTLLPVAMALASIPATAGAETTSTARFQIVAVSDGVVRLDTQTGAMTHCRDAGEGLNCTAIVTDEPKAALAKPDVKPSEGKNTSLQDFDQALGMMERAMKSFMSITKETDKSCSL
jgi:hypothetical protein